MDLANPVNSVSFRSAKIVLPTSERIQTLYAHCEERFGNPEQRPYPAGLEEHIPTFLSETIVKGRITRSVPIWDNVIDAIYEDIAGEGVGFNDQRDVDRNHLARILGCEVGALDEFQDLINAFATVDEDVRLFSDILRERLDHDRSIDAIVRWPSGMVNIEWYAAILDCDALLISKYHQEILVHYELPQVVVSDQLPALQSRGAYGTITEERVRALLERDFRARVLVFDRGGKTSRKHYAKLLGCTPSALTKFAETLFREYERRGQHKPGVANRLSEIREWLTAEFAARRLPLTKSKIDRTFCAKHFGYKTPYVFNHTPVVVSLLEGFDRRVVSEGYLLGAKQNELEALKARLADNPEINKDLLTVNRPALAKKIGVTLRRIHTGEFRALIKKYEQDYLKKAKLNRINPYFHGRVWGFEHLQTFWPRDFLINAADAFKAYALSNWTPKSTSATHRHLVNMLDWMGRGERAECRLVVQEAVRFNRILTSDAWDDAVLAYDDALAELISAGELSKIFARKKVLVAISACEGLAAKKLVPRLSAISIGPKNAKRMARPLATVINVAQDVSTEDEEIRAIIGNRLIEAAASRQVEYTYDEVERFVTNMVMELRADKQLPSDVIEACKVVLDRRLNALRDRAIVLIFAAMASLDLGRTLMAEADIQTEKFQREYFAEGLTWVQHREITRAFFPYERGGNETDRRRSLANLLAFAKASFPGMLPPQSQTPLGSFFTRRYDELGGMRNIAPMLYPTAEGAAAVLALYLVESGANPPVGREISRRCYEDSEHEGFFEVTGSKASAGGKPIIMHFAADDPVIMSLDWLRKETTKLAELAGADSNRLFLMRSGSETKMMNEHWFRQWFQTFSEATLGFSVNPNMIRPSVLLRASLQNEGRLQFGMAIGQHGLSVTQGYQQKFPVHLKYDELIRAFQQSFEALVASSVEDAAQLLRISTEEFDRRVGGLQDTGLGVFCKDRLGRPGSEGRACIELDCWNCKQLLIVAEVEAIATLQLWQESLRSVRGEWERDRPERWEAMWLPWLCLADVVQQKMSRNLILVWDAAHKRAEAIKALPNYVPCRPW